MEIIANPALISKCMINSAAIGGRSFPDELVPLTRSTRNDGFRGVIRFARDFYIRDSFLRCSRLSRQNRRTTLVDVLFIR